MPKLSNIKFQKYDQFANPVFIAEENENYNTIKTIANKLKTKYSTFLPFYHNEEHSFSTIRFIKNSKFKFEEHCFYDIEYVIMEKNKGDKTYVNCHINKMTFVSRKPYDTGKEIEV